jgi:hypothetical protein
MKIVLATLSGATDNARAQLAARWPDGKIVELPRSDLQEGRMTDRRRRLRSLRPDVFAVMTESLAWQFGKHALMLFGALSGAAICLVLDSRGEFIEAGRSTLLLNVPARIAAAYVRGRAAISAAIKRLKTLEKISPALAGSANSELPVVAYLRTTPAAGTVPGGATSHINGVVNGLKELGAKVGIRCKRSRRGH